MKKRSQFRPWFLAVAAQLFAGSVAFAQGCALCYTQAAGSGHRMIAALRSGIVILMVPPMFICLGLTWMAYRKRNQFNDDSDEVSESGDKHTDSP